MGNYYYSNDNKKLIRKAKRDQIASDIVSKFNSYYADLEPSRAEAVAILKELFPSYHRSKKEVKKIPDVYEQYKTYTSALFKGTYQNYDSIVDVEGQDLRSNNRASMYKASLVYDYYKMGLKKTLDAVADDWAIKGEGALFVHWDRKTVKKPVLNQTIVINTETGEQELKVEKGFEDVVEHEGVHIKRIDPHNLYYDKSQRHNWDMCGKIYRDFIPIQYILSNKDYKLTDVEKNELREMIKACTEGEDIQELKSMRDRKVIGNTIEVLEYRGDYITPDTYEILRDVEIVVIAGKYLARLEESQYPKCPIIYDTYMPRPDTGRGQSPLKPAYILSEVENRCIDLSLKAWELSTNPVFLAPKGAFSSYTKLEGGKPLEYNSDILGGQVPQKVDFSAGVRGFEFQQFFKQKMEGATGITQYLQGSGEGSVRTASESTYINQGANMRMAREAYMFSERIILPMVKTHALFKKYYDTEDRIIKTDIDGKAVFTKIDEEIRNGNYTFIIGGSQSQVEREAETQKLFMLLGAPAFQSLAQLMDVQTASEFLKWVLNRNDFKGTEQVFEMMNINSKIQQTANNMGIRPENQKGFASDMMGLIGQSIPDMGEALALSQQEEQQEQLPQ